MPEAFTIKINGLDKLTTALKNSPIIAGKQIGKAIALSVALVNRNAKLEAPAKTGILRAGIHSRINPLNGKVESTVNYGIFVHEGTSPHIIRYKKSGRGGLYNSKTKQGFGRLVHHPGTKANPFMKRGAERSEIGVQGLFSKAINNIVRQIAR